MPRFHPAGPAPRNPADYCPVSAKKKFATEEEALREARWLNEREGLELGVYLCMSCDSWHFTNRAND